LSFECGWWERGKAERVLPAFVRARPCKKGPFFSILPITVKKTITYIYLLSVIAVFCCLASFFYFKIFG
jgi:hypothetical protein